MTELQNWISTTSFSNSRQRNIKLLYQGMRTGPSELEVICLESKTAGTVWIVFLTWSLLFALYCCDITKREDISALFQSLSDRRLFIQRIGTATEFRLHNCQQQKCTVATIADRRNQGQIVSSFTNDADFENALDGKNKAQNSLIEPSLFWKHHFWHN